MTRVVTRVVTRVGRVTALLATLLAAGACGADPAESAFLADGRGGSPRATPPAGAPEARPGADLAAGAVAPAAGPAEEPADVPMTQPPPVVPRDRAGATADARPAPRLSAAWQLANAVVGERYVVRAVVGGGTVEGRITVGDRRRPVGRDTSIVPTHDLQACRPYTDTRVPSRDGGVGEAVVWLAGVRAGPPDTTALRARVAVEGCRLEPRVQRVRLGSTMLVASGDAMSSLLRFTSEMDPARSLADVAFTDAGQVVPVETLARVPGLLRVRDARHPWVSGLVAVAPHPWVAVTDADGAFSFGDVPPGRYTLVVWQETLGMRTQPLRVDASVRVRVTVAY